jgi:hypothetical protein
MPDLQIYSVEVKGLNNLWLVFRQKEVSLKVELVSDVCVP